MIAAGIVAAVLLLIAFLPVGARLEYGEDGFSLSVLFGFVSVPALPSDKKKKAHKSDKRKPKQKKTVDKAGKGKKPGTVKLLLSLLPELGKALNRFRKKLTVHYLTVCYTSASSDPFKTAVAFGMINAGVGTVMQALSKIFTIRRHDIKTAVSFTETEPTVFLRAKLTIRIWQIVYIAVGFAAGLLKITLKNNQKGGKSDGKASDRRPDGDDHAEDSGNGGR